MPPALVNEVNVRVAFPLLLMVNVRSAVDPILTLPNARLPETVMIRVAGVDVVGAVVVGEQDRLRNTKHD